MRSKTYTIRIGNDIAIPDSFDTYLGLNMVQVKTDGTIHHTYENGERVIHLDTDAGFDALLTLIRVSEAQTIARQFKKLLQIKES